MVGLANLLDLICQHFFIEPASKITGLNRKGISSKSLWLVKLTKCWSQVASSGWWRSISHQWQEPFKPYLSRSYNMYSYLLVMTIFSSIQTKSILVWYQLMSTLHIHFKYWNTVMATNPCFRILRVQIVLLCVNIFTVFLRRLMQINLRSAF